MYYQGLLSLIAPSQMMICGTLTLRYLFRIVLSGAVAKGEDFITSGSVTRQGGKADVSPKPLPIAFSIPFTAVSALPMGINSINNYDSAVALSATEITVRYFAHYFIAFGI